MSENKYPLAPAELADKDMLVAAGWTYKPDEKCQLISPDGKRFIWMSTALVYYQQLQDIEKNGITFKIAEPYKGFGYGVWFRTAKYKSYKLISIIDSAETGQEWVNGYIENPSRTIEYWNDWDTNNWNESSFSARPHRFARISNSYDSDYYAIPTYTHLVNLCIDQVMSIDRSKLPTKSHLTSLSFRIEDIPDELKEEAQRKIDSYNKNLAYTQELSHFLTTYDILRNLPSTQYKKYHLDFVNFVLRDFKQYFNEIDIFDTQEPINYICKN